MRTKETKRMNRRTGLLAATVAALLLALAASPAAALSAPLFELTANADSNVQPGTEEELFVSVRNVGDEIPAGPMLEVHVFLPPGIVAMETMHPTAAFNCPSPGELTGDSEFTCTADASWFNPYSLQQLPFKVQVEATAPLGPAAIAYEVEVNGAPPAFATDPLLISAEDAEFGIDALDSVAADPSGATLADAAGRPASYLTTFEFPALTDPNQAVGSATPVEDAKTIAGELPPGFFGNTAGLPQCTIGELAANSTLFVRSLCKPDSQVGTLKLLADGGTPLGPVPLFNMAPPPEAPARFAVNIAGTIVVFDALPRSGGDYGLTTTGLNTPQALTLLGVQLEFWGVPSDEAHRPLRACPGLDQPGPFGGPNCESKAQPRPFFRLPTSCSDTGLPFTGVTDSWQDPGDFKRKTVLSHQAPGYPFPSTPTSINPNYTGPTIRGAEVGLSGCEDVPFEPTISAAPTTNRADSPSGLLFDLNIPQEECWGEKATVAEAEEAVCQSDLREAVVRLPAGMSINPAAAAGLGSCSEAQIGYLAGTSDPFEFTPSGPACPDNSKIGRVRVDTPVLAEPLQGDVYLARQSDNPADSLLGMYLVAEGPGVVVKQFAQVSADPDTGQITTRFAHAPQTPFSTYHVELFGGPRATLRTPPTCGAYSAQATLTPWSGNPAASRTDSFQITQCGAGGFDPKLAAGTQNPLAGSFSPFHLRLSRDDGTAELGALALALPPGLVASLKDLEYCPDSTLAAISTGLGTGASQIASPSCPAGSLVGTVTAGAGAGPNPFFTSAGKAYWAGPYKGAPVSLAVVVPAVAGPFDLGSVVVRNRFAVDPQTAKITAISDPFPTIRHGIPLDVRDVRVDLNRPNYTLNPTSCDPLAFDATIASATGQSAERSVRFQVAGCDRLKFRPRLSLRLRGKTNRGANPALQATLRMPKGGANLKGATVTLPRSEFLDQAHIGTVCTRVQFAAGAGGGAQCPPRSVYGQARAYSPILGYYLKGPVFLRSSNHELPDLVLALHGPPSQPIQVEAVGRIDSIKKGPRKGGIRSTFESVPDVPVSKVVLNMLGGRKGLLQNSVNICKATNRAQASFEAHNGAVLELTPALEADCGAKGRRGKAKPKPNDYRR